MWHKDLPWSKCWLTCVERINPFRPWTVSLMQTTVKSLSLGWISVNNHHSTYKKVLFIFKFLRGVPPNCLCCFQNLTITADCEDFSKVSRLPINICVHMISSAHGPGWPALNFAMSMTSHLASWQDFAHQHQHFFPGWKKPIRKFLYVRHGKVTKDTKRRSCWREATEPCPGDDGGFLPSTLWEGKTKLPSTRFRWTSGLWFTTLQVNASETTT